MKSLLDLAPELQAGDLILFGGHSLASDLIRMITDKKNHAVSHCGVMVSPTTLVEATTLNGQNGVATRPLQYWVDNYPGEVWVKYLKPDLLSKLDSKRMIDFFLHCCGEKYDKFQAFLAPFGIETPDAWGGISKWYCSKIAACGYIEGGILPPTFDYGITPAALMDLPIFTPTALQLRGSPRDLK